MWPGCGWRIGQNPALVYLPRCTGVSMCSGSGRGLDGKEGPKAFVSALKWGSEHGYGKPGQELTLKGDETKPLIVRGGSGVSAALW